MDEAQKRYVERSAKKYRATFYMPCARSSNGQRSGRSHRSRSLSARRGSQKRGRSRRLRIRSRMPPGDGVLWRWDTETDQGKLARPGGSPLHPYPDPVNPVEPIPGARGPVCLKFRRRGVGAPSTNGGRRRTAGELEINMNRKKGRAAVPGGTAEAAGISDQEERFAQEYASNGGLAQQAALAAGYAKSTASKCTQRLVGNCRARIRELQAETAQRLGVTRERVIEEVAAIAFSRLEHVLDLSPTGVTPRGWEDMPPAERAAVAEASQTVTESGGTIRVKMHDKLGALDKLARTLGLYDDKLTVTTPWSKELASMTAEELRARADALRAARDGNDPPARLC